MEKTTSGGRVVQASTLDAAVQQISKRKFCNGNWTIPTMNNKSGQAIAELRRIGFIALLHSSPNTLAVYT